KEGAKANQKNQPFLDDRYLTLGLVVEAVRAMKRGEAIAEDTLRMLEKDDWRLYGIAVRDFSPHDDGTTADGTVVTLKGKTWVVVSERRDGKGYREFKLHAAGKSRKESGTVKWCTTLDILEHADGLKVVKLEEERKRVELVICDILCFAYVHVYKFIMNDPKIKRKKQPIELGEAKGEEAKALRKLTLDKVKQSATADIINIHELALLGSDKDLQKEIGEANSLSGFLGLDRFAKAGYSGLMQKRMDFHGDHLHTVNRYIRGAQSAYRLGRPVCMESCMAPLSAGGDHTELPPGVKLEHWEMDMTTFICERGKVGSKGYGLATRALLARARDSDDMCKWYSHVPLYRLMLFSRAGKDMKPTSENGSR
ncbi:unnamed protein product, partial [Sphacelaria rigidula]